MLSMKREQKMFSLSVGVMRSKILGKATRENIKYMINEQGLLLILSPISYCFTLGSEVDRNPAILQRPTWYMLFTQCAFVSGCASRFLSYIKLFWGSVRK